jgi:hypothetical protein
MTVKQTNVSCKNSDKRIGKWRKTLQPGFFLWADDMEWEGELNRKPGKASFKKILDLKEYTVTTNTAHDRNFSCEVETKLSPKKC